MVLLVEVMVVFFVCFVWCCWLLFFLGGCVRLGLLWVECGVWGSVLLDWGGGMYYVGSVVIGVIGLGGLYFVCYMCGWFCGLV